MEPMKLAELMKFVAFYTPELLPYSQVLQYEGWKIVETCLPKYWDANAIDLASFRPFPSQFDRDLEWLDPDKPTSTFNRKLYEMMKGLNTFVSTSTIQEEPSYDGQVNEPLLSVVRGVVQVLRVDHDFDRGMHQESNRLKDWGEQLSKIPGTSNNANTLTVSQKREIKRYGLAFTEFTTKFRLASPYWIVPVLEEVVWLSLKLSARPPVTYDMACSSQTLLSQYRVVRDLAGSMTFGFASLQRYEGTVQQGNRELIEKIQAQPGVEKAIQAKYRSLTASKTKFEAGLQTCNREAQQWQAEIKSYSQAIERVEREIGQLEAWKANQLEGTLHPTIQQLQLESGQLQADLVVAQQELCRLKQAKTALKEDREQIQADLEGRFQLTPKWLLIVYLVAAMLSCTLTFLAIRFNSH